MKSRKTKLTTALTVLTSASVLLAACGGAQDPKSSNKAAESKPAVDIKFPLEQPAKMTVYAAKNVQAKKDYNEMKIFKDLQTATNLQVTWWLAATNENNERKNLMMASNELPEAFYGVGTLSPEEIVKYGADGTLVPLEKYIDQYAPNLKKVFEKEPGLKKLVTAPDGHIYSLPAASYNEEVNAIPGSMMINKKWLEKLGLQMPKTTEELYQVLKAFKEKDPNGNGKADEIPMSFLNMRHQSTGANVLGSAFGRSYPSANSDFWSVKDGKVSFAPTLPENKEFLLYMNKLYQDGLIDREVFTHKDQVYKSKITSNPSLVGVYFDWSAYNAFGKTEIDYVALPPLKGPNGTTGWSRQDLNYSIGGFSVTKLNKNPELAVKWADQSYDPLVSFQAVYGPIGTAWKQEGNKLVSIPAPQGMTPLQFRTLEAPGPQGLGIILKGQIDQTVTLEYTEKLKEYKIYEPFMDKEWYPRAFLSSAEDANRLKQWSTDATGENAYLDQQIAKIIIDKTPDADWNKMVDQLKKYGLDDVTKIAQKYYDSVRK